MNEKYSKIKETIVEFIRAKIKAANKTGAVIGMSGGIDSTLTAYLTVEAVGASNVLGILLPERNITPEQDIDDILEVVNILGINYRAIEISGILQPFLSHVSFLSYVPDAVPDVETGRVAKGNLKARIRMCMLYYYANSMNRMVIGTGNRTELMLGYFTKYGDGGVDIEPIGGLYKTQVRGLARHLGVPANIINKPPTAGLWPGQTDEGELGIAYETADRILFALLDEEQKVVDVKKSFPPEQVEKLLDLIRSSEHKRIPALSCGVQEVSW